MPNQKVWNYKDYLDELRARYAAEKDIKLAAYQSYSDALRTAQSLLEEASNKDRNNFAEKERAFNDKMAALSNEHTQKFKNLDAELTTTLKNIEKDRQANHDTLAEEMTPIDDALSTLKDDIIKFTEAHKTNITKQVEELEKEKNDFINSQEEERKKEIALQENMRDSCNTSAEKRYADDKAKINETFARYKVELPKEIESLKNFLRDSTKSLEAAKRHIRLHALVAYTLDPNNGAITYNEDEDQRPSTPEALYEFVAGKINNVIINKKLQENKITPDDLLNNKEKTNALLDRIQEAFPNSKQLSAIREIAEKGYLTTGFSPFKNPGDRSSGRKNEEMLEYFADIESILIEATDIVNLRKRLEAWKNDYISGKKTNLVESLTKRMTHWLFKPDGIGARAAAAAAAAIGKRQIETGDSSLTAYIDRAMSSLPDSALQDLREKDANRAENKQEALDDAKARHDCSIIEINYAYNKNCENHKNEQERVRDIKFKSINKLIKKAEKTPLPEEINALEKQEKSLKKEVARIESEHAKVESNFNDAIRKAKKYNTELINESLQEYNTNKENLAQKKPTFAESPYIQIQKDRITELKKSKIVLLEKKQLTLLMLQVKAAHDKYMKYTSRFRLMHGKKGRKKASLFYAGSPGRSDGFKHLNNYDEAFEKIIEHLSNKVKLKDDLTIRNHSFTMYLLKELFNKEGGSFSQEKNYTENLTLEKIEARIDKGLRHFHYDPESTDVVTTTNVLATTFDGDVCNKALRNRYRFYRINDERKAVANTLLECYKRRNA